MRSGRGRGRRGRDAGPAPPSPSVGAAGPEAARAGNSGYLTKRMRGEKVCLLVFYGLTTQGSQFRTNSRHCAHWLLELYIMGTSKLMSMHLTVHTHGDFIVLSH